MPGESPAWIVPTAVFSGGLRRIELGELSRRRNWIGFRRESRPVKLTRCSTTLSDAPCGGPPIGLWLLHGNCHVASPTPPSYSWREEWERHGIWALTGSTTNSNIALLVTPERTSGARHRYCWSLKCRSARRLPRNPFAAPPGQGPVYSSVSGWNWNHPNQNDMCVGIRGSCSDSSAVLTRNSSVTRHVPPSASAITDGTPR